jgi:hypothetical protein
MKQNWKSIVGIVVASGFAVALHAQTAATPAQNASPAKVTLTGCVERADQVASSGASATTVDSLSFVLMHASKDGAAESRSEAVGTSGTASTPASGAASTPATGAASAAKGDMYRLDADVAKLNPHVGHKVEVTGVLDSAAAGAAAATDPPSRENAPRMKVESVKMLAETCAR